MEEERKGRFPNRILRCKDSEEVLSSPYLSLCTSLLSASSSPEEKQILLIFSGTEKYIFFFYFCRCIFLGGGGEFLVSLLFLIVGFLLTIKKVYIFYRDKFINIFFMESHLCLLIKAFPQLPRL